MTLKEIKTERLTLRELTCDDWKNYLDHVTAADEFYVQYGYEPTDELLDLIHEPTIVVVYYSIIKTDTNEMVGYIGINEINDNIEFYIFKEHRSNDFCCEALGAFTEACLSGEITGMAHEIIVARTLAENMAAQHVLEKAGFEKEAFGLKLALNEDKRSGISGVVVYSKAGNTEKTKM